MSKCLAASILILAAFFGSSTATHAEETGLFRLTDRAAPVGIGAREPSLATLPDGRIILSWTEEKGAESEVRMAILDGSCRVALNCEMRNSTKSTAVLCP